MSNKTCCFTGHRPKSFIWGYDESHHDCVKLKQNLNKEIEDMIINFDVDLFYCGMALGTDTWAAEEVISLKKKYPHIRLVAVIPFPKQASRWSKPMQIRYKNILNLCDDKIIISNFYAPYCMLQRNLYMVNHSDYVIAVWNKSPSGGTAKTIQYAQDEHKQIFFIEP